MLSNFVDGELKDLFDDMNKAIVDAHRIIQEITLNADECNVAVEKLQTCVLTSRELVISPEGSDVSLYKFMQLLKKIPSPTGSTALADLVFDRLKVIVNSKLEAEDETKVDDAIDKRIKRIYDEIKNVTNKMESFGIEQIFTKLDSQVTKVEKMATDKLAELESNVKTFFSKSDNIFEKKSKLSDSMEHLVGGKQRLDAINKYINKYNHTLQRPGVEC